MSMRPGHDPAAAGVDAARRPSPRAAGRRDRGDAAVARSGRRSAPLRPLAGSMTRAAADEDRLRISPSLPPQPLAAAPASSRRGASSPRRRGAVGEQEEHGHAHGDAVGDLVHDQRGGAVGDVAGDLDAAVDRPGMEDDDVGLGLARARRGSGRSSASTRRGSGRKLRPCRSRWRRSIMITSASRTPLRAGRGGPRPTPPPRRGSRVGGPTRRTVAPRARRAWTFERVDAAVQDVADDRDRQAVEAADVVADGQQIEQRLGRMLVRAVAGVDHRAVDAAGEEVRRARPRGGG